MLEKENWNSHGVEATEDYTGYNDGDLIDKLYEIEKISSVDPVMQEELETIRSEVDKRGIIATRLTEGDLFREENVIQTERPKVAWCEDLPEEYDAEDTTMFGILHDAVVKKQAEDSEVRKIPDNVLSESYNTLREKLDEGTMSQEDTSEYDELSLEMKRRKMAMGKDIKGGIGDSSDLDDFSEEQINMGVTVEMEHTDDPAIAEDIVRDHLTEDPKYYTKLKKIESICDALEENRYYYGTAEEIIQKTASKFKDVDAKEIENIYYDRYI